MSFSNFFIRDRSRSDMFCGPGATSRTLSNRGDDMSTVAAPLGDASRPLGVCIGEVADRGETPTGSTPQNKKCQSVTCLQMIHCGVCVCACVRARVCVCVCEREREREERERERERESAKTRWLVAMEPPGLL